MSVAGLAAARLTGVLQPVVRRPPSAREPKKTELADSDDSAEKDNDNEPLDLPKKNLKNKTDPQPAVAWKWQSVNKRDGDFKKTKSDAIGEGGDEENEPESTKRLKRNMQASRKAAGKARLERVANQNGNSTEETPSKHKALENRRTEVVQSKNASKAGSGNKSAEKASAIKAGGKSVVRTSEEDPDGEDLDEAYDTNVDPDTEQIAGSNEKRKVKRRSKEDSDDDIVSGQLVGSRDKRNVKSRIEQDSDDENTRGKLAGSRNKQKVKSRIEQDSDDENARGKLAGNQNKQKAKSRIEKDSEDENARGKLAGNQNKQKVKSRIEQDSDDENARGQRKYDKSRDDDKSPDIPRKRSSADEADEKSTRPHRRGSASQKFESRKPSEKTSESVDAGRVGDVNDQEDLDTSDDSPGPSEKTRDSDGDQTSTSTVKRNRDQDLAFPSYRLKDKDIFWKKNPEDDFWG
ncbi:uncharacterized protein DDB_G0283697-like [Physella acuta]|uniref:uncharacterized protein DDB_G0283697-like n=1 Tax=Physella acuta TaxID=109671 RepID=UPI0027DB1381|nr:uncharacterized protein DDB_G0283697-like [Physella acuta]